MCARTEVLQILFLTCVYASCRTTHPQLCAWCVPPGSSGCSAPPPALLGQCAWAWSDPPQLTGSSTPPGWRLLSVQQLGYYRRLRHLEGKQTLDDKSELAHRRMEALFKAISVFCPALIPSLWATWWIPTGLKCVGGGAVLGIEEFSFRLLRTYQNINTLLLFRPHTVDNFHLEKSEARSCKTIQTSLNILWSFYGSTLFGLECATCSKQYAVSRKSHFICNDLA